MRQSQSHLCRWQTCLYQPVYSKSHFFKAREGGLCNSQRRKSILVMCETHLPLMAWFLKLWMWEVIFSTLGGGAGKSLGLCCHWGGQWHWGGHVRWQTGRLHMLSTYLCSFSFCMHLQRKGLSYLQEESGQPLKILCSSPTSCSLFLFKFDIHHLRHKRVLSQSWTGSCEGISKEGHLPSTNVPLISLETLPHF